MAPTTKQRAEGGRGAERSWLITKHPELWSCLVLEVVLDLVAIGIVRVL